MPRTTNWLRLDNAGKIFPSTSTRLETGVFRFACEMTEPINAAALQTALDNTLEQFPHFLYALHSGLFWYYLEACDIKPKVHIENTGVCTQLFYHNKRTLLFDVSYYNNIINLEIYHALTDGTGAMQFLKCFLIRYLAELYPDKVDAELADELSPAPMSSRAEDSFKKYYKRVKTDLPPMQKKVYHLRGTRSDEYVATEGLMPCNDVLALAKSHNTSLTIFLCAVLVKSIQKEMQVYNQKKPVVLTIPVNLRNYFPSETARNFFGNIRAAHKFGSDNDTLDDIIASLGAAFKKELTTECLSARISRFMSVERNPFAKIAPLGIKNISLKAARRISNLGETMVLSNVGIIGLPAEIAPYVSSMSIFASTNKIQACVCTCGDILSIGFTSRFEETDIQCNFFRMLADMGVKIEVRSNSSD